MKYRIFQDVSSEVLGPCCTRPTALLPVTVWVCSVAPPILQTDAFFYDFTVLTPERDPAYLGAFTATLVLQFSG